MFRVGSASSHLRRAAWVFAATFLGMSLIAVASGMTLGLFFAGFALCVVAVPWVSASERAWGRQVLMAASVTDAIALVWLIAILIDGGVGLWGWLWAYCVCLGVALMQFGIVQLLRGFGSATSAGVCTLATLMWIGSPVWLFPHLSNAAVQRVIDLHPLFAINTAIPLSVWTEAPLAYRLLNLNQDVAYSMPAGVWWCVVVHCVVGLALIWVKVTAQRSGHTE